MVAQARIPAEDLTSLLGRSFRVGTRPSFTMVGTFSEGMDVAVPLDAIMKVAPIPAAASPHPFGQARGNPAAAAAPRSRAKVNTLFQADPPLPRLGLRRA